jgi:hypothetical protein
MGYGIPARTRFRQNQQRPKHQKQGGKRFRRAQAQENARLRFNRPETDLRVAMVTRPFAPW